MHTFWSQDFLLACFVRFVVFEYVNFFVILREIFFLSAMCINLFNIYLIKNCNLFHEYSDHIIQFTFFLSFLWISFSFIFITYVHSIYVVLTSSSTKTVVWHCCDCFSFIIAKFLALLAKMFRFFTIVAFLHLFEC